MRRITVALVSLFCSSNAFGGTEPVKQEAKKLWLRHVLPLPHEISISRKVVLRPEDVSIKLREGATAIEMQAAEELRLLFKEKADVAPEGQAFEILLGVLDSRGRVAGNTVRDAERLETLPNSPQAYLIQPVGSKKLVLAALSPKGVWNAAATLRQLMEPHFTKETVAIPLARVVDWPDFQERGLWNFPKNFVPWLASLKLNFGKMSSTMLHQVERGKPNHVTIDVEQIANARARAFNLIPYIIHLNFLHVCGLTKAYPELAGKGDGAIAGQYFAHRKKGHPQKALRAPCASNPILAQVIAEWMADIASQGANDISCWLTERPAQCQCAECLRDGQFVWEARAFVTAWQEARKKHPDLIIRLFLSTTTNEKYDRVLAEAPPEVKIERACAADSFRTPQSPRHLFRTPLFDEYAAKGTWMASYDVPITANGAVETPEFKVPESSAYRVRDFVQQLHDRHHAGAYGMLAWVHHNRKICGYNISALAEWSWNLKGRSEEEFAIAWATRNGHRDPEKVGEWAVAMGPIEFDVYDSDFPTCYSWGKAVTMFKEKQHPVLGEGMFRYYLSADDFDRKAGVCRDALKLAEGFEDPYLALETKVVFSYAELAGCIYRLALLNWKTQLTAQEAAQFARLRDLLKAAGDRNAEAIAAWRNSLGDDKWHRRVQSAIDATLDTVKEILDTTSTTEPN